MKEQLERDVWRNALWSIGSTDEAALQAIARSFSLMREKDCVTEEEMMQLAERGIPAWNLLARAYCKTIADVQRLAKQGEIKGAAAVAAITAKMRAGFAPLM
jgi:tape measure domain-containing protein